MTARYVICNDLTKNHAGNITDISTRTQEQCKLYRKNCIQSIQCCI